MAVYEQISSTPSLGDFPFKNYGGSTVAANQQSARWTW